MGFDLCGTCYDRGQSTRGRFNQAHTAEHRLEQTRVPRELSGLSDTNQVCLGGGGGRGVGVQIPNVCEVSDMNQVCACRVVHGAGRAVVFWASAAQASFFFPFGVRGG